MTFYRLQNEDVWVNLMFFETISIFFNEQLKFEVRGHTTDSNNHYLIETFDDKPEAEKFLEYILSNMSDG